MVLCCCLSAPLQQLDVGMNLRRGNRVKLKNNKYNFSHRFSNNSHTFPNNLHGCTQLKIIRAVVLINLHI